MKKALAAVALATALGWSVTTPPPAREVDRPLVGRISAGGPLGPDGKTEVACDLPREQRIKNIGSKLDGAGMCVFSSCEMAMRWANLEWMRGWRDWCAAHYPGGGYPEKVDRLLAAYCQAKSVPVPDYVQVENGDPQILVDALKSGRIVGVTYAGHDVHYNGTIAHMVCLVAYDPAADLACVLDNNFIEDGQLVWLSCAEFLSRWRGNHGGWAVIFLAPGPPPVPHN